jgi:serine/threonine protein kinase
MNYPDFSPQGYEVIRELGRNREGGRIAWLASNFNTGQQVVVKQFCFAQVGSNWSAFKEHEREIQVLKELNHPGIPEYLGAFETSDGFCLVQEYKNAVSLAEKRSFDPEEIKQIAIKALEIFVYLQNRIPPVIHRDVKPENILVDEDLNVYLIDFGMSRIGSQEVAASSVFQGTPGFIPPEQLRKPTPASDLYGLGGTLICLLTGTKSTQIQDLTDDDDPYVINFRHLLPRLSMRFLDWLELMVKPRVKERFADAQTALEVLKPLHLVRVPEVKLTASCLVFEATHLSEKVQQSIGVFNTISDTVLQGKWEVAPHPHDPPHTPDSHPWIVVEPAQFSCNDTVFTVQVDTSKLMADKFYERRLLLRINADVKVYNVTLEIQTAPLLIAGEKVPYVYLIYVLLLCTVISLLFSLSIVIGGSETVIMAVVGAVIGAVIAALIGIGSAASRSVSRSGSVATTLAVIGAVLGAAIGVASVGSPSGGLAFAAVLGSVMGAVSVAASVGIKSIPIHLLLLTSGLGISIGIGLIFGFLNFYILLALSATGLPLARMLVYAPIERRKLIAEYRQSEAHLIKP